MKPVSRISERGGCLYLDAVLCHSRILPSPRQTTWLHGRGVGCAWATKLSIGHESPDRGLCKAEQRGVVIAWSIQVADLTLAVIDPDAATMAVLPCNALGSSRS